MAEISKIQPFGSSTQYDLTDNNAPRKDGAGATGTWGISITGNANTATKATQDSDGNQINTAYLKLSGGTMTGKIKLSNLGLETYSESGYTVDTYGNFKHLSTTDTNYWHLDNNAGTAQFSVYWETGNVTVKGTVTASKVYGAVWNDYAEMRNVPETQINWKDEENARNPLAGRCVHEVGDDTMVLSTERMQPGCKIISDTFGFNIGETDNCKTPIAVSGRALVYIYEGREAAQHHIGQPVCSGPDGTVSIMTDEEYAAKGYCCVGTISAVPEYETWGSGNVQVDGRIWIYIK